MRTLPYLLSKLVALALNMGSSFTICNFSTYLSGNDYIVEKIWQNLILHSYLLNYLPCSSLALFQLLNPNTLEAEFGNNNIRGM